MNARDLIADARLAVRAEFESEAVRLGATVRMGDGSLVATWPELAGRAATATLNSVGDRLVLTETAALRVPEGFPAEWLERLGYRAAVVGCLREHLRMVERVTGVPLLGPPGPLMVEARRD